MTPISIACALLITATSLFSTGVHAKIIKSDDMVAANAGALNLPPVVRQAVDTIGLMSVGCTGTHIGSNLVVSAGHCFSTLFVPPSYHAPCQGMTIQWGVRGDRRGMISRCTRIVAIELSLQRDWVVFEVDRAPSPYSQVELQSRVVPRTPLTILSHPENLPLRWSRLCRALPFVSASDVPSAFHHQCDTNPGSSGAPIYDARTMKLVGIHNGGFSSSQTSQEGRYNYATYITDIPWERVIAKARVRGPLRPFPGMFDFNPPSEPLN